MKRTYEIPIMEMVEFLMDDIIATSGLNGGDEGDFVTRPWS